ncbi:hypothetical protein N8J89_16190 [Crossiella sp. CA-258035]|uniref:hypothetical protein n=1 Tax=Crossiella sp. CA-258035 TaxID=2981138 RepID=UPI0024BC70C2|nr:hypothetical protein [Crossiella sp. CA-258035]WHT22540.1 hypothetical protein N8J89_16190 [Crossiella sp. CA-258035]
MELEAHLAQLVDELPELTITALADSPVSPVELEVFTTLIEAPHQPREQALRAGCPLDCLQWNIARRGLQRRGWLTVHPARGGGVLLAPTAMGRGRSALGAAATWFEQMVHRYGAHAELVGHLHDDLGRTAQRWLDPGAVLDAAVVREGRGVAALAVHPRRRRPDWPVVLAEVLARGCSILLLWAWPEHRLELAGAVENAARALSVHYGRLSVVLESAVMPGHAGGGGGWGRCGDRPQPDR